MRHFKVRQTKGKYGVKHGSTLVDNTGPAVGSFFTHVVFQTGVGSRVQSGAPRTLQEDISTDNNCQVGDLIKYVNLCMQCSPRGVIPTNELDNAGWLEWGLIWQRERDTSLTVANIGVETLGVLLNRTFRENCLYTGCFAIGTKQANAQDVKFKLPKKSTFLHMGDILQLVCYVRTSNSADARTDSHRLIVSSQYKSYN